MYQYRNASQLRSPTNLFEQNAVELVKVKSIGETKKESGSWRSAGSARPSSTPYQSKLSIFGDIPQVCQSLSEIEETTKVLLKHFRSS